MVEWQPMSENAFQRARVRRSWTYYRAAQHMEGVSDQSLKNIERGQTDPGEIKIRTALAIIQAYWPDVTLQDFCPGVPLKLVPKDRVSQAKEAQP